MTQGLFLNQDPHFLGCAGFQHTPVIPVSSSDNAEATEVVSGQDHTLLATWVLGLLCGCWDPNSGPCG